MARVGVEDEAAPADPAADVEILRTAYGVPHIVAANLWALGFGLAYAQIEDYGDRVVYELVRSNGRLGMHFGPDSIGSDFDGRRARTEIRVHRRRAGRRRGDEDRQPYAEGPHA